MANEEVVAGRYRFDNRNVHVIVTGKSWLELVVKIGDMCTDLSAQKANGDIELVVHANRHVTGYNNEASKFLKEYNCFGDVRDIAYAYDEVSGRFLELDTVHCKDVGEYNQVSMDTPIKPFVFVMVCAANVLDIPSYNQLLLNILQKGRIADVHVLLAVMTCASKVPASISTAFVRYA